MKAVLIQPSYAFTREEGQQNFEQLLSFMDDCPPDASVIVLPEYSDLPWDETERFFDCARENGERLKKKAAETAVRCGAVVFVNCFDFTPFGARNTTFVFDTDGKIVGKYYKEHPAPSEVKTEAQGGHHLDVSYSYEERAPLVLTLHGVKYAFLTCYDFYFYEYFARLAQEKPDVIIGCSLQRTDPHGILEVIGRFLCYNTNAYLLRASMSMGEDAVTGGSSMAVSPAGEMLANMKSRVGVACVTFDPSVKYGKPAGFGGTVRSHPSYAEEGRRPWLYRPAGPGTVMTDEQMGYPRLCAHRGFSAAAPENTLPAFGAAVALGAQEIEFDLWRTKDGELVSLHDPTLDRVSDGHGFVGDYTLSELQKLDFGKSALYRGLHIARFEDILKRFAGRCIMNVHVKIWDRETEDPAMEQIVTLLRAYGALPYAYVMSVSSRRLREAHERFPELRRCKGYDGGDYVREAVALSCEKVQLFAPYFTQADVDYAHAHGVRCNVFFADEPEKAREYLDMGIDTILTNQFQCVLDGVRDRIK